MDHRTNTGLTDSLSLTERPMYGPLYPPYSSFYHYNEAGTTPAGSLLASSSDVQFADPTATGDMTWPQSDAWGPGSTTGLAIDTDMSSSSSLIHNAPVPFAWGMSNFEPMVTTAWPAAGSPSLSCLEGPTSAGGSSQQSFARTPSSDSRRPSLVRCESSNTTLQMSPPDVQQYKPAQAEEPQLESRFSKRRQSALEPREATVSGHRGKRPVSLTPSMRPTPSPQNNTISALQDGIDGQTHHHPSQRRREFATSSQNSDTYNISQAIPQLPSPHPESHAQAQASLPPPLPPPQQTSQALRERNRAAANKCRRKSKAVVADLEATERELAEEHDSLSQMARALKEEVLVLKNALLVHGHCEDEVIQQYLANSARMVGSGEAGGTLRSPVGFLS